MKKKSIILLLGLLLTLTMSSQATALGVTPAGKLYYYEPGTEHDIELNIVNNQKQEITVALQSDYPNFIEFSDKEISFTAKEKEKKVIAHFTIPQDMPPGRQIMTISITEQTKKGTNTIQTLQQTNSQIIFEVPYPGKYVVGSLQASTQERVSIPIQNQGTEEIQELYADVSIQEETEQGNKEEKYLVRTNNITLASGETEKIRAQLTEKLLGEYLVQAKIHYDKQEKNIEETLLFGKPQVELHTIILEKYKPGEINKIELELENTWNKNLEVSAQLDFLGETLQTNTITLHKSGGTGTLETFWQAEKDLKEGNYKITITLQHEEQEIIETTLHIKEQEQDTDYILISLTLILLLTIGLFIRYLYKQKK